MMVMSLPSQFSGSMQKISLKNGVIILSRQNSLRCFSANALAFLNISSGVLFDLSLSSPSVMRRCIFAIFSLRTFGQNILEVGLFTLRAGQRNCFEVGVFADNQHTRFGCA